MKEQRFKDYTYKDGDSLTDMREDISQNLSNGWLIKTMIVLPETTFMYTKLIVLYEREKISNKQETTVD